MNDSRDGAGAPDTDRELAALLRSISRDVAHELRGPVQSVVVNLEVLKSRAAKGELGDVRSRADILEQEVHRLWGLADAVVSLLREPPTEPSDIRLDTLLATAHPIIHAITRARHVEVTRHDAADGVIVRVHPQSVVLGLVRLVVALCAGPHERAGLLIAGDTEQSAVSLRLEIGPAGDASDATVAPSTRSTVEQALPAANAWLSRTGGTAALSEGSEGGVVRVSVRLPQAT